MRFRAAICLLVLTTTPGPILAGSPRMSLVAGDGPLLTLLQNGTFEQIVETKPARWNPAGTGFVLEFKQGRAGSTALFCTNTNASQWTGASQTLILNRTSTAPIVVRGWSKADNVSGTSDSGYSLYADLIYTDGTPLWGQTANFRCGTHDWQHRELLIYPEKPIRSLTLHCMLRGHSGKAWFDDVSVEELVASAGAVVFDGVPVSVLNQAPRRANSRRGFLSGTYRTKDGLQLQLRDGAVASLRHGRREVAAKEAPSGFLVRDVAANSGIYEFQGSSCPELELGLQAECVSSENHITVRGRISNLRGSDRAVTLYFALPLARREWHWGQDIRRERLVEGTSEHAKLVPIGCGATGTMSLYPLGSVWAKDVGIGLGIDMNHPAQYRIAYNHGTGQLFLAYDFALVPETEHFPGSANFSFVLFCFEPEWGFRAAFDKYTQVFPDHFKVRSPEQGIWMPFTDISTVQGWEDFGFKYHEGVNNVPWDDTHGILSFRYTEPMTWWMRMPREAPRTIEEAQHTRERLARGTDTHQAIMARVAAVAGMWDESQQPALSFRDTPWCDGAVWSINPNPNLPTNFSGTAGAHLNGATVYWNESIKEKLYGSKAQGQLDGEYLDSLEGYVTTDFNFRREHFRHSTVPLTYTSDSKQPALFKGLAVYEFTKWLAADVHSQGKLMFANGVPYRLSFLCPWLDIMGTETDWLPQGKYRPSSDEQMCLWRTMSGKKPYLLLMNTDYEAFTPQLVEKYFQRSLFYGMFPSMFSHNASENPYWQNPTWYNRDRHLFKRYIPIVRKISNCGWDPVTLARCTNPRLYVERFGPGRDHNLYFTVFNDTEEQQSGRLRPDLACLNIKSGAVAIDLVTNTELQDNKGWDLCLLPQQVAVLEVRTKSE